MGKCRICGKVSPLISSRLGVCSDCLRHGKGVSLARALHKRVRKSIGLPAKTPSGPIRCPICGRGCGLGEGSTGYCGLRAVRGGLMTQRFGSPDEAPGLYYYDPHPTNCVAGPVCPATTGIGYPKYALGPEGERGYLNIAVFYGGCNLDCLYCQNWEHKLLAARGDRLLSIEDLVEAVNERTTCVCFFGGDPGPFAVHALRAAEAMVERARKIGLRVFRVCWETNGLWSPSLWRRAVRLSLETGGIVKVDMKAWNPHVFEALSGAAPEHLEIIKENVAYAARLSRERPEPPLLVVSTLLVTGYVGTEEVEGVACFLADLDPEIPYVLLAFHPDHVLDDLLPTPRAVAEKAVEVAKNCGLKRIYVGNEWLLT